MKFVEERPCFDDLHRLANNVDKLASLVRELAEGEDVTQRACDLYVVATIFLNDIKTVCVLVGN